MNVLCSIREPIPGLTYSQHSGGAMSISFIVPGKAVGWQRARRSGNQYFTATETRAYQQSIAWSAKAAGVQILQGPVRVLITVYHPMPKSMSQKARLEAVQRVLRPTVKPDMDNVLKTVLDALNGVAYVDDNQVTDIAISKFYGDPQISVTVGPA